MFDGLLSLSLFFSWLTDIENHWIEDEHKAPIIEQKNSMKTVNTWTWLINFVLKRLMSIGQINQSKKEEEDEHWRIVGWLSILVIDERKSIIHMRTQKTHLNCVFFITSNNDAFAMFACWWWWWWWWKKNE